MANFFDKNKTYVFWGAIGVLSFVFAFFLFSAFGIYIFGMKDNFFVCGAARVFPYPVARVNRDFVLTTEYQKDVDVLVSFYKFEAEEGGLPVPGREEIGSSVLSRLIRNKIMEKMARDFDIKITNDELNTRFLEMTAKMGSPEEVEEILDKMYGWSEREFRKNIVRNILLQEKIKEKLAVGEDLDKKIEEELEKATIKIYIK